VSKSVLCTCEDVTLDDVRHAIDKGYRDIESIKRYTGFGTGVCQGKTCLSANRPRTGRAHPERLPARCSPSPRALRCTPWRRLSSPRCR
jgi:sarcosine oxidase subunit beta